MITNTRRHLLLYTNLVLEFLPQVQPISRKPYKYITYSIVRVIHKMLHILFLRLLCVLALTPADSPSEDTDKTFKCKNTEECCTIALPEEPVDHMQSCWGGLKFRIPLLPFLPYIRHLSSGYFACCDIRDPLPAGQVERRPQPPLHRYTIECEEDEAIAFYDRQTQEALYQELVYNYIVNYHAIGECVPLLTLGDVTRTIVSGVHGSLRKLESSAKSLQVSLSSSTNDQQNEPLDTTTCRDTNAA